MPLKNRKLKKRSGQTLIIALTILSIMLVVSTVMLSVSQRTISKTRYSYNNTKCISLAEAGIDYGIRQLNINTNYTGTSTPIDFGGGQFEIEITGSGLTRELTSYGYIPSKANPEIQRTLRVDLNINDVNIQFPFGVQSGEGGINMENNSTIVGDIYSNGPIDGSSGNSINGSVKVANNNAPIAPISWETSTSDFIFGQTSPITDVAQSFIPQTTSYVTKLGLYLKQVGSPSNIDIYILGDNGGQPDKSAILGNSTIIASGVTNSYTWVETSINNAQKLAANTKYWFVIDASNSNSKYWKIAANDNDSLFPDNTAKTSDNWDAHTPVWNSTGKDFNFRVYFANNDNYVKNITVAKDLYAHNSTNSIVGQNFYGYTFDTGAIGRNANAYELKNCTVGGAVTATVITNCISPNPPSTGNAPADLPHLDYPITEGNLNQFKAQAESGGTLGDQNITSDTTLGPVKIVGNLNVSNGVKLTLTGTVYVTGAITLQNNSTVALSPSYGPSSGIIITDQPVNISNNVTFQGSDPTNPNTYILLISTSNSLSSSNPAININNNSDAAIVFAPYGLVNMANNAKLKETTGYRLNLSQRSQVTYEATLQNVLFSFGPSGGWRMKPGSWRQIK